jgi:phage gp45-like
MRGAWPSQSLEHHDAIGGTLRRATILKVDDSGPQQLLNLQGLAADFPRNVVHIFPHGFSSNSPLNAEGILKSLGGRSDRAMFIGGEHPQYRQRNLPSGNAVLYDDQGNVVWMKGAGGVTIQTAAGEIAISSAVKISIQANGDITVDPGNGGRVLLGGGGETTGTFSAVVTVAGPALNVLARIA